MAKYSSNELVIIKLSDTSFDDIESLTGGTLETTNSENACLVIDKISGKTEQKEIHKNLFDGNITIDGIGISTNDIPILYTVDGKKIITSQQYAFNSNPISVTAEKTYCFYRKNNSYRVVLQWLNEDLEIIKETFSDEKYVIDTCPLAGKFLIFYERYNGLNYYSVVESDNNAIACPSPENINQFKSVLPFTVITYDADGNSNETFGSSEFTFTGQMCAFNGVADTIEMNGNNLTLFRHIGEIQITADDDIELDSSLSDDYYTVFKTSKYIDVTDFKTQSICNYFPTGNFDDIESTNIDCIFYNNGNVYFKINNLFLDDVTVNSFKQLLSSNPIHILYHLKNIDTTTTYNNNSKILATYYGYTKIDCIVTNNVKPILNITIKTIDWYNSYKIIIESTIEYGSELTALRDLISSKVWMTDITTAIDQLEETEITVIKNQYSEINQTISVITSTVADIQLVTGDLGNRLSAAESEITQTANEITSFVRKDSVISSINQTAEQITINASKIKLEGIVTANSRFKILSDGSMEAVNGKFSGTLQSAGGTFTGTLSAVQGSFTKIYTGSHSSLGSTANGFYAGTDGMSLGSKFKVSNSGVLTCSGATLGGTLNAVSGSFTKIYTGSHTSYGSNANGFYAGTDGMSLGSGFRVTNAGALTCTSANISGTINASGGSIGNNTISNGTMTVQGTGIILPPGGAIGWYDAQGNGFSILQNFTGNNPNIMLNAVGNNLYLGYLNTKIVRIGKDNNGTIPEETVSFEFWFARGESLVCTDSVTAPNLQYNSSEKIKDDIEPFMADALGIVKNTVIYEYRLKTDKKKGFERKRCGFVIERETPEMIISQDKESIDLYSSLGILWKAVQELSAQVKELKQQTM